MNYKYFLRRKERQRILKFLALLVLLILVLGFGSWRLFYHHTKKITVIQTTESAAPTVNTPKTQPTTSSPSSSRSAPPINTTKSHQTAGSTSPSTTSNSPPAKPSGTFVSNHNPDLSGTAPYGTEDSVCITSPGATCYIEFSNNGDIKKLPAQVADANGVCHWTWNVQQAGFSQGSWTITTIATLNSQSINTQDNNPFEVKS